MTLSLFPVKSLEEELKNQSDGVSSKVSSPDTPKAISENDSESFLKD